MSKAVKNKKDRVPKITEEEYARYISALKSSGGNVSESAETQRLAELDNGVFKEREKTV